MIPNPKDMTSRERLWAVLNGEQPDRVPIWMLFPRQRLSCYVDVHTLPSYAQITPAIMQRTDWLDRRSLPAPAYYSAATDVEVQVSREREYTVTRRVLHTPLGDLTSEHREEQRNAAGATVEHYCKDISDLEKILAIPYEPVEPDLTAFNEAASKLGEDGLMMANLGMPVGTAYGSAGPQDFALWTLTELDVLVHFTQVMFDRQYAFLEKALDAGVGPVFFTVGSEFVAPPMCSPKAFDALVKPFDGPIFDLIHHHNGRVIVHHHGNISGILERIADMGADAIQPIEEPPIGDCTLAEAKARIGERVCLVGTVQYDDFQRLTPDEMEGLVKRQIRDGAQNGGMILAPTAGPYAAELTPRQQENYLRMIQAGLKWGRYPLAF